MLLKLNFLSADAKTRNRIRTKRNYYLIHAHTPEFKSMNLESKKMLITSKIITLIMSKTTPAKANSEAEYDHNHIKRIITLQKLDLITFAYYEKLESLYAHALLNEDIQDTGLLDVTLEHQGINKKFIEAYMRIKGNQDCSSCSDDEIPGIKNLNNEIHKRINVLKD